MGRDPTRRLRGRWSDCAPGIQSPLAAYRPRRSSLRLRTMVSRNGIDHALWHVVDPWRGNSPDQVRVVSQLTLIQAPVNTSWTLRAVQATESLRVMCEARFVVVVVAGRG